MISEISSLESSDETPTSLSPLEKFKEIIVLCDKCAEVLLKILSGEEECLVFCNICMSKKKEHPTYDFSTVPIHSLKDVNQ